MVKVMVRDVGGVVDGQSLSVVLMVHSMLMLLGWLYIVLSIVSIVQALMFWPVMLVCDSILVYVVGTW